MPTKSSRKPKSTSRKAGKTTKKKATAKKGATKKVAAKKAKKSTKSSRRATAQAPVAQLVNTRIIPLGGPDAEDKVACRKGSKLSFDKIVKRIDRDNDPKDGRPRFTFFLADVHAIFFNVPGCNPDGFFFIPERSANLSSVGIEYLGVGAIKKIRVKLFIAKPLTIWFTLAFRLRFEENYFPNQVFNPKRKSGSIKTAASG